MGKYLRAAGKKWMNAALLQRASRRYGFDNLSTACPIPLYLCI
jgi:hypothetical protein